jgi:hypothetical protein
MSSIQDDFTSWYIHGMNSGYFKRLGLPQIPTIFQQPEPVPMMYQQLQPIIYQQPAPQPMIYQQTQMPVPALQVPVLPISETNNILARATDPRLRNLPETDPRRIRSEQTEQEDKKIITSSPPAKIEPYPEHSICIKWLKKEECNGSCNRQHYRYNLFKMRNCKYWLDNNCRFKDPIYCNHAHGYNDPYAQIDYQRESGFKRGRF